MPRYLWWFRELLAIVVWLWIPTKLFIYDFDSHLVDEVAPGLAWIVQYRFFVLLAVLCVLCPLIGRKWLRSGLLFVLCYPLLLIIWRLPCALFRNWAVVIVFTPTIYSIFTTFRSTFIWGAMAILAGFIVAATTNAYFVIPGMSVLLVFLVRHLWRDFRRAYEPSLVFVNVASVIERTRAILDEHFFSGLKEKLDTHEPESEEYNDEFRKNLQAAFLFDSCFQYFARKLKHVAQSRKLDIYFVSTLLLTFLVTATVFAFQYWGLYKLDPESFRPSENLVFWDFLGL